MCIMRKESSCQIFAGICNTKELMSPLCHLLCNTKQTKRESACWLHGSPGCTGLTGDGRAAFSGHQQNFIAVCCASARGFIYIRSVLHPFQQRPSCGREAPERRRHFYCQMMKAKLWCLLTPSHELATVTPKETCCRETRNLQRRILLTWINVQCNRFRAMKQSRWPAKSMGKNDKVINCMIMCILNNREKKSLSSKLKFYDRECGQLVRKGILPNKAKWLSFRGGLRAPAGGNVSMDGRSLQQPQPEPYNLLSSYLTIDRKLF